MTFEQRIDDWSCGCESRRPVRRVFADGRKHFGEQCLDCGKWFSRSVSSFALDQMFDDFDEGVKDRWVADRQERTQKYHEDRVQVQADAAAADKAAWMEIYKEFLGSPRWQEMRRAVIMRDANTCQSCLGMGAQQVHHRVYPKDAKDLFTQPMFELIAVCRRCHERIHGK